MKFILVLFVYITIVMCESYIGNAKHPDYPDQCYYEETEHAIDIDDTYKPIGICAKLTCRDDFVILVNECTKYRVPENCKEIVGDLTLPYPECCVQLRCIDRDGDEVIRKTTTC